MVRHITELIRTNGQQEGQPLMSGYNFIDNELGGYHPGELMTVCGVEDSGKSAFIVSQVDRLAIMEKVPTLVGIGVMDISMFLASMIAYHYDIETNNLWGLLEDPQYKQHVNEFKAKLNDAPLYIVRDDFHGENWNKLLGDWIKEKGIRIAFLDEFEMITFDDSVSKLKKLATDCAIPIVRTDLLWRNSELAESPISLSDLNLKRYEYYSSMSDTVIAFNDYDYLKIYCDERGIGLCGVLGISILKQKGAISKKSYRLLKKRLYYRTRFSDKRYDVLEPLPVTDHF